MNQNFKDKVQSMTGKEIVMAMVNGLLHGHYTIAMSTFGRTTDGICYGCAATNCITEISGVMFDPYQIDFRQERCNTLDVDYEFLNEFENAIDELRQGYILDYNSYADRIGISQLPILVKDLPRLELFARENHIGWDAWGNEVGSSVELGW